MSSELAIRTSGLGKRYPFGTRMRRPTLRERVATAFSRPTHGEWALEDVSIEVPRGRAVGILGSNGAGKSTLLRILGRITEPTVGRAELRGRVASLLDVGAGFHTELSGRENLFLNGAILGMKRAEVAKKLESIVEFAEIGAVLDAPVKLYSTGMYLRLAFSVAAHLESDILLVDEVLAVGDARFQRKCLARMSEVLRDGRTVLLVSHATDQIRRLCSEAIWLDRGRVVGRGPTRGVVDDYLAATLDRGASFAFERPTRIHPRGSVSVHRFELRGADGTPTSRFGADDLVRVAIDCEGDSPIVRDRIGFVVVTAGGDDLFGSFSPASREPLRGGSTLVCDFPAARLAGGEFSVELVSARTDDSTDVVRSGATVSFTVESSDRYELSEPILGSVRVDATWRDDRPEAV